MISTEKPGTPEELVHYGVKGMKWGVRKQRSPSDQVRSTKRKATAKKVAIGAGTAAVILGSAYVAYKFKTRSPAPTGIARSLAAREAQKTRGVDYVGKLTNAQWDQKIKMQRVTADLMSRASYREAYVGGKRPVSRNRRASKSPVDWSKAYVDFETAEIKFRE